MDWIPFVGHALVPPACVTPGAGSAAPGTGLTQSAPFITPPTAGELAFATTK